jgi:predicted RND superfamily exporter protein
MTKPIKHAVDAVVPSETAQFDTLSPIPENQREAYQKLVNQLSRARNLVRVLLNSEGGPGAVVEELYLQKVLARAELITLTKIVEEKLGISPADFVQQTADQIEKMMEMEQMANKIIITPEGVFRDNPNGG